MCSISIKVDFPLWDFGPNDEDKYRQNETPETERDECACKSLKSFVLHHLSDPYCKYGHRIGCYGHCKWSEETTPACDTHLPIASIDKVVDHRYEQDRGQTCHENDQGEQIAT